MKKVNFGVVALILGLTLAITGSAFKPAATDTIYWFESDASGTNVGAYLSEGPECQDVSGDLCALGFTADDIENPSAPIPELKEEVQTTPLDYDDAQSRRIE